MSTVTTDSPPPSPSQPSQFLPVPPSISDGLPSPTTSHSDESAPGVGELANLSDAPSSDWTGSDEESDPDEHDFDMVASIDLSEAGSLGHRSTASSSGSGPGMNKMKLSYPNPMTTNEEVEPDSMDEYQPDSTYSFLHDASSAVEQSATDACSVMTDDTSSTSDKVSGSVLDVRKAETTKWVETAAGNSPKRERRRSTVTSLSPKAESPTPTTTPQSFPDVKASVVVPGAYSISQHTEPDSAASSFASIKSSDSNATIVTPKPAQPKPLYSQVVAEGLPDEPATAAPEAKVDTKVEQDSLKTEVQLDQAEEPARPVWGSSHLVTRSLIVVAAMLAISTVKLIESVPSFADLGSRSSSTALSTSLAAAPPSLSSASNSVFASSVSSSAGWAEASSTAQHTSPSALAVVPPKELIAVEPAEMAGDEDDWIDDEEDEADYAEVLEMIAMEEAQEREAFEIDQTQRAEDETGEAEDDDEDSEHDLFNSLLRGVGAAELADHVNELVGSVGEHLSPYFDSVAEAWYDSFSHIPNRLDQARHAHRQLRHRGRKAIGRRIRQAEQHGAEWVRAWGGLPARQVRAAWSQTTDAAKAAAHGAEEAWTGSKEFAGEAWAKSAEDEPEWTKRQEGEDWSILGQGSIWKGLARRGVQGERLVRSPARLSGLLGKSVKRAREIKHEVDTFRREEARKHRRAIAETVRKMRRAMVDGRGEGLAALEAEA